jgi:excisionase family DNA binding protein
MEERHLSLSEVAGLMDVSERTVRRWIKSGKLRAYKPGRDYRIPESAVRQFMQESEISPKALAPPSLFNGLEDARRAEWENAVRNARELREYGQQQIGELLSAWQASKDRGEDPGERRPYLDEIGELLQEAYDAERALVAALSGPQIVDQWPEVQAADRFYIELWRLVEGAGLSIRTGNAQEERPEAVEEREAA